ncbi:hypothetical protein ACFL9T_07305 [Thermodesulfobacteriota bacterium]
MAPKKQGNIEGDVILVYYQDEPAVYARIEAIEPDVKKDWYQLTLTLLTFPSQAVTWILRGEYINGSPFTMGGQSMRLEAVQRPPMQEAAENEGPSSTERKDAAKPAKVIPLKKQS